MNSPVKLSPGEARRIALAAQGFHRRPRGIPELIRQLGLIQLDFVNAVTPAHYLVPYSRLGPYDRRLLDHAVYRSRRFTEQWGHEASIVPMETWPLLRWRRETHRVRPYGFEKFLASNKTFADSVLEQVRTRGPLTAEDLEVPHGVERRIKDAWFGTPRATLEAHFGRGVLAIDGRRSNFARVYDLAERIIPRRHFTRRIPPEDARRELLRIAARALGIATAGDLADYFRMPVRDSRAGIGELVESGELVAARVESWRAPAYLHKEAAAPPKIEACALLAPFDPLIFFRPRLARLFQFDYRFEVFIPVEKRRWGAYVMPFLLNDRLVARVDLKADRKQRRLAVLGTWLESGVNKQTVTRALGAELNRMGGWLGLDL